MTDTPVASNFPPKLKENPTNLGLNWNLEMIIRKLRSWEKQLHNLDKETQTTTNSKRNLNTRRVKLETDWWGCVLQFCFPLGMGESIESPTDQNYNP